MNQLLKYHISHASGLYLGGPYSYLGKKQYDKKHVEKMNMMFVRIPSKTSLRKKLICGFLLELVSCWVYC